jgi:hypothetical protein
MMGGREQATAGATLESAEACSAGASDERVRRARALLASLCGHLPTCADDVAEVIFTTAGATAAMLYPRRPWPRLAVARAVSAIAPSAGAAAILLACAAAVPSARHALRVSATGAASLFFPIDLPADRVAVLAAAFAPEPDAAAVARWFAALGRPACGFALEVDGAARARARWYAMVGGGSERRAIALAARELGIDPGGLGHLDRAAAALARGDGEDLVWNVSTTPRGPAVKLELPAAGVDAALAAAPSHPGADTAAAVRAAAAALATRALSYLGLRAFAGGEVEASYYLDARAWLPGSEER